VDVVAGSLVAAVDVVAADVEVVVGRSVGLVAADSAVLAADDVNATVVMDVGSESGAGSGACVVDDDGTVDVGTAAVVEGTIAAGMGSIRGSGSEA